jgi:hypothetical protein
MPSFMPLLALLALTGAAAPPHPLIEIALDVDARLPPVLSRLAVQEMAAIWAPYGVAIATVASPAPCPLPGAAGVVLTVRIENTPIRPDLWSSPFASIRFVDGVPEPTILLHYGTLTRLGLETIVLGGEYEAQWPRRARDLVLGRMIGRVLAHEVGHWLLRARGHSPTGLMRAVQRATELAEPGRAGFRLDPKDVVRLKEIVVR